MSEWTRFADARDRLPKMGAGLGYRAPLRRLFRDAKAKMEHHLALAQASDAGREGLEGGADHVVQDRVEWAPREHLVRVVEVVAEHFFSRAPTRPAEIGDLPVLVHCLDFSLGTPGDVDEAYAQRVDAVLDRLGGCVLSDHLAFTKTGEVELGHLNPVPPTRANVRLIAEKIRRLQQRTGVPFLLENITTHLSLKGDLSAAEFYQEVVEQADCGMLLDVTNVMVNCRNRNYDPLRFLDALDLDRVVQLHLVGYSERGGVLYDSHTEDVTEDLFALTEDVIARAPVEAIIIERDGHFPENAILEAELRRVQDLLDAKRARESGQAA